MITHHLLPLAVALVLTAPAPAAPIVHYTFDGDTGNVAVNSGTVGTSANATITGGSFVTDAQRGGVLSMAGASGSNFATVGFTSTTGSYTFAMWYKGTDTLGFMYDQGGTGTTRLMPSLGSSTEQDPNDGEAGPGLGMYDGSAWKNSGAGNTTWTTGQWVHLAWVFENNGLGVGTDSMTIYLNGVAQDVDLATAGLQTKRAIANIPSLGGTQRLFARFTGSGSLNELTGLIDDYRIYDTALSASEILDLNSADLAIASLAPEGLGVSVNSNLVATFNQPFALTGSGSITLVDTGDGSDTVVLDVTNTTQVSISGNDLILNPPADLAFGTSFEIVIDGNAITDTAAVPNAFPGTTSGQWTFTTAEPGNITYVDADNTAGTGNTVLDGPGSFGPTTSTTADADGMWSIRTRSGVNGGSVLAAVTPENATPRLTTTFTLPGPGLYTIYGYFWNNINGSGVWDAEFKLGNIRPATIRAKANATNLGSSAFHFANPAVAVNDGTGQVMFEAMLGTWNTTTEGLTVTIHTDDPATGGESGNTEERTWFDGVGYEPSTLDLTPGVDSDNDGLDNLSEINIHGTDPTLADTDGDGRTDGQEVTAGTDPLVPNPFPLPPGLPADAMRIQTDGAWTWFNDHTARFVNGDLYVGYVKGQAGKMAMTRYDFDTDTAFEFLLGLEPSKDDHDVPNVTVLPDGRILSVYSRHDKDWAFYHRTSLHGNPTSLADWGPEQTRTLGNRNSYANTFRLSAESDKIYNFSRNINFNPTLHTSTDQGQTWSNAIHFIVNGTGGTRPYPRYATNHFDRIDLIYTDGHPRDVANSIYHLFYQAGDFHQSNGTVVKNIANLPLNHATGERGTVVYPYSTAAWGAGEGPDDWIPSGRAWTWDIQYQPDGKPVCVFQVQSDGAAGPTSDFKNDRIYYYYARWDGSQWRRKFIAHAGHGLFSTEDDYGGGITIDPENPNIVYLSSNVANPFDLTTLTPALNSNNGIYEIYRGVTSNGGATWTWETITSNSDASNMRPFVPEDHGRAEAVVWFRGRYTTFLNYDCDVYGIFSEPSATGLRMRHVEWSPGGATFKWASIPGKSYRIAASTDLQSFPIDVATGISAQGDTTYQPFSFPPAVSGSSKAFFRVEEE